MKRIIRQILGWGMMLTLPLVITSCGELFDMLDNPITPALQVLRAQLTLKVGESKPVSPSRPRAKTTTTAPKSSAKTPPRWK